jgi:alkanesulfonate monooxygenase SsuD/methylene tetrahydromethanopterin reductase-like flavin-dependent oxidoreductase (luciferase family)
MFIMRFTERAYVAYTEADVRDSFRNSVRLTFPNRHFDPALGADLYNEYLDEYEFSEEAGFDGLMLNEHHNTPTCMGAAMNLEAAILARITKKAKIVLLGNPLPIFDNPIRLAEELAEIDMISRGRLVSGFVRGTGIESWATNTNPVHNRERFEEAHDLVIKTWTTPGPFSFGWSIHLNGRCKRHIRRSGFRAWAARRRSNGRRAITIHMSTSRRIPRLRSR